MSREPGFPKREQPRREIILTETGIGIDYATTFTKFKGRYSFYLFMYKDKKEKIESDFKKYVTTQINNLPDYEEFWERKEELDSKSQNREIHYEDLVTEDNKQQVEEIRALVGLMKQKYSSSDFSIEEFAKDYNKIMNLIYGSKAPQVYWEVYS